MDMKSWATVGLIWMNHPWKITKAILRWLEIKREVRGWVRGG